MARSALLAAFLVLGGVHGHGVMTKPISRGLYVVTNATNGLQFAGECPGAVACT